MQPLEISLANCFTDLSLEKSADDLKSSMIMSFETAIDQGLAPPKALAVVLEWAAEESGRLGSGVSN